MAEFQEIKAAIDERLKVFDDFKKTNDERLEAIEKGLPTGELDEKMSKIGDRLDAIGSTVKEWETEREAMQERIEELEAKKNDPGFGAKEKRQDEYKQTFLAWIRSAGQDADAEAKMRSQYRDLQDRKEVNIGTPASGGYAVPEEISRMIELQEAKFSPVRDLVKVVASSTSDYKELVDIRGKTAGWVGEQGSRDETNTPQLRERVPTHGELYAYPQSSEWAIDDIFFNVEEWLARSAGEEFALETGDAVIRGDGTNKPTGLVNTAPVATDDTFPPTRSAEALESVAAAGNGVITMDEIIDLVYTLNSRYLAGSSFAMSTATAGTVRKLKSSDGTYYWQPSTQVGEPDTLLGYPVAKWEQLDPISTAASTNYPIMFGNFGRGYVLNDIVGTRITRDDVTNPGFVRWYIRRRLGGIILNNNAIKVLAVTTT